MAGGWKGANECSSIPCEVCGTIECERRFFHGGSKGPGDESGHIVVCEKCAKQLSDEWYGCGCGG